MRILYLCCLICCFNPAVQASQKSIELAFGQTGYDYSRVLRHFEQKTGIKINTAPQENYDLKAELIKRSGKKRLPDAFIGPADYTTIQSVNLMSLPTEWLHRDLSPEALQTVTRGTETLAIPLIAGNHLVMYYNRTLIKQPANSMAQLADQAESLPDNARLLSWSFSGMYFFIPFLSSFDALPMSGNDLHLDTPQMAEALEYYWQLPGRGLVQRACSHDCYPDAFKNGEFAYVIDGAWNYRQYQQALGEDLGVALLPAINGNRMRPYFSAHVLAFVAKPYNPKQLQNLKIFAQYLQSHEAQQMLWESARAIPSNQFTLASITRSASDNTRILIEQLKNAHPMPNNPYMSVIWEAMSQGFSRYGANIISAPEAAELMQHLAERTIEHQQ